MKVALVHELLTMKGGAERVLKVFADMFPDAPIYTLLHDDAAVGDWFPRERIRHSTLHKWSVLSTNHHLFLSHMSAAVEAWDFSEFDLVISSSSAFVHGIITNGNPKHLCYVHSPARYLWDRTHDVLEQAGRGPFGFLRRKYLSYVFHKLRIWDAESAARPDQLLAASKEVQRRIELYWRRESVVLHPPIDTAWFVPQAGTPASDTKNYYLIVSTLAPYKRIEIAIEACNKLGTRLLIAGSGRAEHKLRSIAGPTVEFLGFQNDAQLRTLYSEARAVIFPGEEDFGLVPLESQACGTPVIAQKTGGALETIIEGRTGEFFIEPNAESLLKIMQKFDPTKYSSDECRKNAERFSRKEFEKKIRGYIEKMQLVKSVEGSIGTGGEVSGDALPMANFSL